MFARGAALRPSQRSVHDRAQRRGGQPRGLAAPTTHYQPATTTTHITAAGITITITIFLFFFFFPPRRHSRARGRARRAARGDAQRAAGLTLRPRLARPQVMGCLVSGVVALPSLFRVDVVVGDGVTLLATCCYSVPFPFFCSILLLSPFFFSILLLSYH